MASAKVKNWNPEEQPLPGRVKTTSFGLMRKADEQLEREREAFFVMLERLRKGLQLWHEKGWEWEDPPPELEPDQWPPLPRLLYVMRETWRHENNIASLRHIQIPMACEKCGRVPEGYGHALCGKHIHHHWAVRELAIRLGLRIRGDQ